MSAGRLKSKIVYDFTGSKLELEFKAESSESESLPPVAVTVSDCHRAHFDGEEILPMTTAKAGWKYFKGNGSEKMCQPFGKNSNGGWPRGISFWHPHCVPKVMVDEAKKHSPEKHLKCCCLHSTDALVNVSQYFNVIQDREYTVNISGDDTTFYHCLLVPCAANTQETLTNAARDIIKYDCILGAGCGLSNVECFNFDEFETAGGPEFAAQNALRRLFDDDKNTVSERIDAFILAGWLGSFEGSIDCLLSESLWAAGFICNCLVRYGISDTMDSHDLMHYHDALQSLQFMGADAIEQLRCNK
jgi:hypothetical protein